MTPREFYLAYIDAARRNERESGVPALFTLAQSALETGWGRFCPGNMMFGIKAGPASGPGAWAGKRQLCITHEVFADAKQGGRFPEVIAIRPRADGRFDYTVRDWFRAYDSPLESFADHARLLRADRRYAKCFETHDAREFARRVAAAGYATAPGYGESLIRVIDMLENAAAETKVSADAEAEAPAGAEQSSTGAGVAAPRAVPSGLLARFADFILGLFASRRSS